MDCDNCGKPAKVHLTQLVDGKVKKVALCNECAQQKGVTDPTGFALADMLLGGKDETPASVTSLAQVPKTGSSRSCPQCGFTMADLKKVRRFGCGVCYATFRDEVNQMVRGMHKGPTHCGKVPEGLMEVHQRNLRLEELRSRLDQAVNTENYEEAAGLRDEIRQLETNTAKTD
ncbi:UvrB/UvrC motif-containing protein [Haloferula sp.]|uniref:UvrB/UvrC motif-containing protein n=1 Tax=Haloferula sp. TaxID=2497595 RepID=UPI0032A0E317